MSFFTASCQTFQLGYYEWRREEDQHAQSKQAASAWIEISRYALPPHRATLPLTLARDS
jgi:hypothetical protein